VQEHEPVLFAQMMVDKLMRSVHVLVGRGDDGGREREGRDAQFVELTALVLCGSEIQVSFRNGVNPVSRHA
jgi:hypothetical protein